MKFSLVMATKGRVREVSDFLYSLNQQIYRDFELIVVDQNEDNRLQLVLNPYLEAFEIIYIKSDPGLSKSRNIGLTKATGDIIGFPDDDCKYPPDLLKNVQKIFTVNENIDGLTGRSIDENENTNNGKFPPEKRNMNIYNTWDMGISYTIFLKKAVVEKVGSFDENLGVGSKTKWGACEETDYLIRALKLNFIINYDPNIVVIHPNPIDLYNESINRKTLMYGSGFGYVLKKHKYPYWYVFISLLRPFVGAIFYRISFNKGKAEHSWNRFKGRLNGYINNNLNGV